MAAHVDVTDFGYKSLSITTAVNVARGIDGPSGARVLEVYVETAAASVRFQVGAGITDGTTDISTGGPIPTETWFEINCHPQEAPTYANRVDAPTVFLQSDTNPTTISYRFTLGERGEA